MSCTTRRCGADRIAPRTTGKQQKGLHGICRADPFVRFWCGSPQKHPGKTAPVTFPVSDIRPKLPQALRTDILPAEHRHVLAAVAENAAGPILFQDNGRPLNVNLQRILLHDIQRSAQLNGQHDTAQLVPLCQVGAKKFCKLSGKPLISMALGFPDGATMHLRGFDRLCYFRSKFDRFAPK